MPRISVVVPIYNVEPYLDECLESIAGQTFRDLEVVMVDDGSKDDSRAIAERFAAKDERFRLLTQPNGGLGRARNNGVEAARGDFLAFVDSDDYLAPNALELLIGPMEETGSDFATGNVRRLQSQGIRPTGFLNEAFAKTRLKTHVSEYPPLIADRLACNKLFRRSFWDKQGRKFPEGVLNEDIPVVLPLHFAARSVDVIADPVYYWRIRDGEQRSITQRRLDPESMPRTLRDRLSAVGQVVDWLDEHGRRKWKKWYFEGLVADDLRLYLNPLAVANDEYRQFFLDEVNAFLDRAPKGIYDNLPAIERLKWHLVRRRLMPELLEVIRFHREELRDTPPLEIGGRWYGDYPFREDERLAIPRSIYLLEGELGLRAEIEALDWDGERLHVRGNAYIRGIGAPEPDTQTVKVIAIRRGRLKRVRLRISGIRLPTKATRRPDVTASSQQRLADLTWSGFEATLDPSRLRTAGRWLPGIWEVYVVVHARGVNRRRGRFHFNRLRPLRGVELPMPEGVIAKAVPTGGGGIVFDVRTQWTTVHGYRLDGDVVELTGEVHGSNGGKARLEATRRTDEKTFKYPLKVAGGGDQPSTGFTARVRLRDLLDADEEDSIEAEESDDIAGAGEVEDAEEVERRHWWNLEAVRGRARHTIGLPVDAESTVWRRNGREVALSRTRKTDAALVEQSPRPVIREAGWTEEGTLRLAGDLPEGVGPQDVLLVARDYGDVHAFAPDAATSPGHFSTTLTPAGIESLAGTLPLREGKWDLYTRAAGAGDKTLPVPLMVDRRLYAQLPMSVVIDRKPFSLTMARNDRGVLVVERDLDEDERGAYHQRRLREKVYVAQRSEPLRDAVVYASFDGREYSDSPRAIHEELVRRDTPVEHLWVVRDGMCEAPASARKLREGSREYYEALAGARFVVSNDLLPSWFVRRPDQVCLQTWHGAPVRNFDPGATRHPLTRFAIDWRQQVGNWQYLLSPNRVATPILRRTFGFEGEMLETGYPRDDVLARADRDELGRAVRRRLGVPDDKRTVLYAPSYRGHVYDRRGNYLLDPRMNLDALRAAAGDDTVILFHRHPYVADPVASDPNGSLRDVSAYPDATELLLAADVLVTDYSSVMFDYANTGRPMLFYTYDLEAHANGGFCLDLAETAPGPLVRTVGELTGALADIEGVQAEYAARYADFRAKFCEFDDGRAAARVVDRLFVQ
ncbi:MAG: CDP-glycerol glycerophosphotransferase [Thermoleophilaceae bacterium]|nr:CDP-glycerol glycerophosphotransferase [Thermoleophilaceae bacterium]